MIEIIGVTKKYGAKTAVDDVSFTARPGRARASSGVTAQVFYAASPALDAAALRLPHRSCGRRWRGVTYVAAFLRRDAS